MNSFKEHNGTGRHDGKSLIGVELLASLGFPNLPSTRPKENQKIREELEKAVHIIWNCRLPSPRCVAIDAVVEVDLVSALQVSVFPEVIFTKAGKILHREKSFKTADELSKIMAFFYYGAAKPPCLNGTGDSQEAIPLVPIKS
ncbi:Thioredoxin-like fold domain-containing protein MRL7L, chloroplastic [Vitis vinifera]|uniref:Thioredoxin-like fold domain-containing protein MRL7L, chloroplastic n=1 Tax=Vitis vinifera TaxID=29760 RepID=A0A438CBP1_VITVI|nr:Thioredoxin-like fold domain-containing protein MRL7L, chloroplastic [Vitis vinifera]